jgi:hypothetical protein
MYWEPDDDMITYLFEDSQPPSSSIVEEYQDVATSEHQRLTLQRGSTFILRISTRIRR